MEEVIWTLDAWEIADAVRRGEVKASELLDISLERIGRFDGKINAFATLDPEGAHLQASAIDSRIAAGEDPGPLAGIPIGIKDLEPVRGLPTGRGSLLFEDEIADFDSTQVARLRAAGAVIIGKTTTPELGTLNYTASKSTGVTRNPWNTERTPGGSSGGSAAAVASGLVPLATGSDGGGSIRIPSAFSGLPGLKPTFGLVPRGPGRLGTANLSCYGPLARSVRDIARFLDQVAGHHPMDPHSLPRPNAPFEDSLALDVSGFSAVFSQDLGFGIVDPEVATLVRGAAKALFRITGIDEREVPVVLPDVSSSWLLAEAMDCYADLEGFWPDRSKDMTPVVVLAMQIAEGLRPDQVADATRGRHEVLKAVNEIFEHADFIVTPTTTTAAFDAEGPLPHEVAGQPLSNPLVGICFTYPFNLTGHPAITVPAGFDSDGMPIGMQIVGPRHSEALLLSVAGAFEREHGWPKLASPFIPAGA